MSDHVGLTLKRLREERGLSKSRLSREAGVSDAYIVQIEKGDRTPSREVLRDLARVLRVPPHALLIPAGLYSPETIANAEKLAMNEVGTWGRTRDSIRPGSWERALHRAFSEIEMYEEIDTDGYPEDETALLDDDEYWRRAGQQSWGPEGWVQLTPSDQRMVQQLIKRLLESVES